MENNPALRSFFARLSTNDVLMVYTGREGQPSPLNGIYYAPHDGPGADVSDDVKISTKSTDAVLRLTQKAARDCESFVDAWREEDGVYVDNHGAWFGYSKDGGSRVYIVILKFKSAHTLSSLLESV